jgi:hypothetical protein
MQKKSLHLVFAACNYLNHYWIKVRERIKEPKGIDSPRPGTGAGIS